MEHREARELLELAAVEPTGLDRLAAGDTPDAGAVASHLAGCPGCTAEFERLRRTAPLLRERVSWSRLAGAAVVVTGVVLVSVG